MGATTRKRAFEVVRAYYKWALMKGEVLGLNPVATVATPKVVETKEEPFTHDEVLRLIEAAARRRGGVRHVMRLIMGPRSGEARGLTWKRNGHDGDVDLDKKIYRIREQTQREYYEHGCSDPQSCVEVLNTERETKGQPPRCRVTECTGPWRHGCSDPRACARQTCEYRGKLREWNTKVAPAGPCPPGCTGHERACPMRFRGKCTGHKRGCPKLCPPGCTGHARYCPERTGGVQRVPLKTRASERWWVMSGPLWRMFKAHEAEQLEEARLAGGLWDNPEDYCFTNEFGRPIDPRWGWGGWSRVARRTPGVARCVSVGRPLIGRHEGSVGVKGVLSLDPGRFFMCP